jgi:hypothetical protein
MLLRTARIVALHHPTRIRIRIRRVIAQSHVLDPGLGRERKGVAVEPERVVRAMIQDLVHGHREVLVQHLEATDASLVLHHDPLGARIQDLVERRFEGDLIRPVQAPSRPFCTGVAVFSSRGSGRRVEAVVTMEEDEGKLLGVVALESNVTWDGRCIYQLFLTCTLSSFGPRSHAGSSI